MATLIGFTMPFAAAPHELGAIASTSKELSATRYNMKSLVLTNWGERPNHFYLGCNLIEFLFAPNDNETHDRIADRVGTQVAQWLPYVVLNRVDVTGPDPDGAHIHISIDFSLKGKQDFSSVLEVTFIGA